MKIASQWIVLALMAVGLAACAPAPEASAGTSSSSAPAAAAPTEPAKTESAATEESKPVAKSDAPASEAKPETAAKTDDAAKEAAKPSAEEQARMSEASQDEQKRQAEKQPTPGKLANSKPEAEKPVKDMKIPSSPANAKQTPEQRMMEGADLRATQASFVGTWTMKVDPKLKAAQAKLIADMKKKGQDWKEMGGTVTLRPNGTFTMRDIVMNLDDTYEGTYKVNKGVAELTVTKINGKDAGERGKRVRKIVLLSGGKEIRRQDSMVFGKS